MVKIQLSYRDIDIIERGLQALIKKDRWGNESYILEVYSKISEHKSEARQQLREIDDIKHQIRQLESKLKELEGEDNA